MTEGRGTPHVLAIGLHRDGILEPVFPGSSSFLEIINVYS